MVFESLRANGGWDFMWARGGVVIIETRPIAREPFEITKPTGATAS